MCVLCVERRVSVWSEHMLYVREYLFVWMFICTFVCASFECILFASLCQREHVSNKLARVRLYVYVSCLLSTYEWVCVCVCVCVYACLYLQPGWPLLALQSSLPARCCCGQQPWSDIWCLASGSGWWPASPLDGWCSLLAPWSGHTHGHTHTHNILIEQ